MRRSRLAIVGVLLASQLLLVAPSQAALGIIGRRKIERGVATFLIRTTQPNVVHVAQVRPRAKVRLAVAAPPSGSDRLAPTSVLCGGCLVAVNGGFFNPDTGLPVAGQWPAALETLLDPQRRGTTGSMLWLVKDGKRQPLTEDSFTLGRHPRTFIFGDDAGRIWLAAADGRQPGYSIGMTLPEVADLTLGLGATWSVNLDGGCSTTFVVQGRVKNRPCQDASSVRGQRPVANAFVVLPGVGRA